MRWRHDENYDGPVGDFDSGYSPQAWDLIVGDEQCGAYVLHMLDDSGNRAFMAYVTEPDPDGSSSGEMGALHAGDTDTAYTTTEADARGLYKAHCKK